MGFDRRDRNEQARGNFITKSKRIFTVGDSKVLKAMFLLSTV